MGQLLQQRGRQGSATATSSAKLWLVQSISLFRLIAALLFASLAFQDVPLLLLVGIYSCAMCSDIADGFLARRFALESFAGKIIDLISDKSLTVVSLLYAAERGIQLLPLALIATREIVVFGLRAIAVDGTQLLPTSRVFGGAMAFVLWSNTLVLMCLPKNSEWLSTVEGVYWACAVTLVVNVLRRIHASRHRLMASLTKAE